MGIMKLNESEQQDLLWESEQIEEDEHGSGRWTAYVSTVVRAKDGKFYRINWERGLTENQENIFEDGEVEEVFPADRLIVSKSTQYLTKNEQKAQKPTLAQKMIGEAKSFRIATGESIRQPVTESIYNLAAELREEIVDLQDLDFVADSGSFREATKQYLEAIIELWEREEL